MILIIAEKPSLARNIAAGIGNLARRDGYLEGEGYLVSWAFGHLFSLCDIEHYNPSPSEQNRWVMDNLPCFPNNFEFELRKDQNHKVDSGVSKQFSIIRSLCARDDVEAIVNAGDADREGEIIVRLCIDKASEQDPRIKDKPKYRLWLPDQTPKTVAAALKEMKSEDEYDCLANEGFARTYIDWLYGVNLTRYATLKTGKLLRVGRVIVPIVKAIYDRDMAIRNFVPGIYIAPTSKEITNGEEIELVSKKRFEENERDKAEKLCRDYNAAGAVVSSVKNKKDKLAAGKLYSLSKLQNYLGKKYKMPMERSLAVVQKLYEEGYLTYPRTNSEYMATAEKSKVRSIIESCKKIGYPVVFKDSKTIFDDSKIESHSAITPTYKIPDKNKLTEDEKTVYGAVMRRFVAVFCEQDCIVSKTQITVDVGDLEQFTLKGTVILEPGWTKYDDSTVKDKVLPKLSKGDVVNIDFKPAEKTTSPPKHYTIETLNNYLKNPFKEDKAAAKERENEDHDEVEGDDSEDYKAIFEGLELGTEATRTGIIDNAKKSGYIALKKDVYTILPDGEFLIESLSHMGISMDKYKTSQLGRALKSVFRAKMSVNESVDLAKKEIREVFDNEKNVNLAIENTGFYGDIVGVCPVCGKNVVQRGKFYGCDGYKDGCKFSFRVYICSKPISLANATKLLKEGKTDLITGFVSPKTGKTFDAYLRLEDNKAVFEFPKEKRRATPDILPVFEDIGYGLCPRCGKTVIKGKTAYGCSGWKEGCDFRRAFEDTQGSLR